MGSRRLRGGWGALRGNIPPVEGVGEDVALAVAGTRGRLPPLNSRLLPPNCRSFGFAGIGGGAGEVMGRGKWRGLGRGWSGAGC
jgi:hypothetical protein